MKNALLLGVLILLIVVAVYLLLFDSNNVQENNMVMLLPQKKMNNIRYMPQPSDSNYDSDDDTLNNITHHPLSRGMLPDTTEINNQNSWLSDYSHVGSEHVNDGIETPLKPTMDLCGKKFASNNHLFTRFGTLAKY
jgi:hypothetical protein